MSLFNRINNRMECDHALLSKPLPAAAIILFEMLIQQDGQPEVSGISMKTSSF